VHKKSSDRKRTDLAANLEEFIFRDPDRSCPEVWDKEVLPPGSPDCIHLDYFMLGVSEL
jgi:hypothetical protein